MSKRYLIIFLFLFTFWVRGPAITQGLPYFYNEDEAHHFNRVVSMVKSGDYNPHYFHKPSLHFYLRMPVVAASFLWNVKQGHIRSLKEIITKDEEGVAGYAFSASHPGIVKWNRAFSVLLGALTVILTSMVILECTTSMAAASIGGLLVALSPSLLEHGATIGVDVVMDFFCLLSTYCCLRYIKGGVATLLYTGALAAGLAISSKYNALPIAAVPILAALMKNDAKSFLSLKTLLIVICGFIVGSPYIFKELPLFLDQFAYEIWHYKIAGHEGHTGEPGIGQAIFYTKWFAQEAFGFTALIAAIAGFLYELRSDKRQTFLIALFPTLFFLLMIEQKVNFTRNMLVVIPYLAIFAACFAARFFRKTSLAWGGAILLLIQPVWQTFAARGEMRHAVESRNILEADLKGQPKSETAVSTLLECAPSCLQPFGVSEVSGTDSPLKVYMDGFNLFVAPSSLLAAPYMSLAKELPGEEGPQRIVKNPAMKVWKFEEDKIATEEKNNFLSSPNAHRITLKHTGDEFSCSSGSEEYCWVDQRIARVYIEGLREDSNFFGKDGTVPFEFTVFNPWEGQRAQITFDDFMAFIDLPKLEVGKLQTFTIDMPYNELKTQGYFIVTLSDIHSPLHWSGSADGRRLGVAIKSIRISPR